MSELVTIQVVGTEFEADTICGLLRDNGIECTHQGTNLGAGMLDGMPGGPREVQVRQDDEQRARAVLTAAEA